MTKERYFITGTDTDCGKTWVSVQMLKQWQAQGERAVGLKPVASGCLRLGDDLLSEDARRLAEACGQAPDRINPWCYEPPIAPHIAAREMGEQLSAAAIAAFCQQPQFTAFDKLIVEGAGGLMVPLNDQENWLDVIALLSMPVILVVGIKLGCINHALLTWSALKQANVAIHGWVANHLLPETLVQDQIVDTLTTWLDCPPLASYAFNPISS